MKRVRRIRRELRRRLRPRARDSALVAIESRIFTCPKLGEAENTNADSAYVSSERGSVAIADGVSRSFQPRQWSQLLVRAVTEVDEGSLTELATKCSEATSHDSRDLSWPEKALRDRFGSQATLLSVKFHRLNRNEVLATATAIGDCLLARISKKGAREYVQLWPFADTESFPAVPGNICSVSPHIRGQVVTAQLSLELEDRLLLMTDALGRYFVRQVSENRSVIESFPFLHQAMTFQEWSLVAVESGVVEDDDLTLVEIRVE
jgi:hypothetical protein